MISLGGEAYAGLRERYEKINADVSRILTESCPVEQDAFTIPFEQVGSDRAWSVGSKNAQLGEIKSQLGLPTPDGFAISAWAYKHFVDANDLQARISECIDSVDIKRLADLLRVSEEIRPMVASSQVPEDLTAEIRRRYTELRERAPSAGVAMRSSAIGEDTLFSFAGQYATFLNVGPAEVVDRYRDVLASKFTSQAIYYYLSHSLLESDLAMAVGCVAMVNASSSGVIYTLDPVRPEDRFAVPGTEYMILSLRMGYHFTTVEAMCTDLPSNNYIRMQYEGGGASQSRRARRIALMVEILSRMGFKNSGKGDFLDGKIAYEGRQATAEKLRLLGRITMMTKQLDMALSNDAVSQWYTQDFVKKLGLDKGEKQGERTTGA